MEDSPKSAVCAQSFLQSCISSSLNRHISTLCQLFLTCKGEDVAVWAPTKENLRQRTPMLHSSTKKKSACHIGLLWMCHFRNLIHSYPSNLILPLVQLRGCGESVSTCSRRSIQTYSAKKGTPAQALGNAPKNLLAQHQFRHHLTASQGS